MMGAAVPNFQGLFLRGYGGQYSYHWGTVYHSSDGLGILQGDAIRNITGSIWPYNSNAYNAGTGAFYEPVAGSGAGGSGAVLSSRSGFDASRVVPTAGEDRPVNMAVRYLVKALP